MVKSLRITSALLAGLLILICASVSAAETFPGLALTGKLSDIQKSYLGIKNGSFTVADIKADFLLVNAFSMYCPICQRDAPNLNTVYDAVSKADVSGKVKFLGIGLGNTPFEVAFFQKKYTVEFPIVWDEDYSVHKALGEVGTPTFYLVKLSDGSAEVVYKSQGEIEDTAAFTQMVLDTAGIK